MEPVEQFYGRIVDMVRQSDGGTFTSSAAIADTVLHLSDVTDFDEAIGGRVSIGGTVYDYLSVDSTASTITLATGLLAAAAVDDAAEVVDPELGEVVVEYVALVLLDEQDPQDQPIEVTVQTGLVNMIKESIRGGVAEAVTLLRDGPDDFMILQLDGKLATDLVVEEVKGGYTGTLQDIYDHADAAAAQAADAAANATTAQTTANGKNKVTYSLSGPGSAANTAGDIWFQKESATQTIIGQWEGLGGTSWSQKTLSSAVIANLDAGKLTAGSAFINGLTVKTNFTLGDASTNGVIQSYNFAGSSVGVFMDKNGLVAKGGSLTGTDVIGGHVKTAPSGNRVEIYGTGTAGVVDLYDGVGALNGRISAATGSLNLTGPSSASMSIGTSSTTFEGQVTLGAGINMSGDVNASGDVFARGITASSGGANITGGLNLNSGTISNCGTINGGPTINGSPSLTSPTLTGTVTCSGLSGTGGASYVTVGNGGVLARGAVVSSSLRLKQDVEPSDVDPDAVLALDDISYRWRNDPDGPRDYGFPAEQAQELGLPFTGYVDHDGEQVPGIDYIKLAAVGHHAVLRHHARKIEALEQENADLKATLAAVLSRLDALEAAA